MRTKVPLIPIGFIRILRKNSGSNRSVVVLFREIALFSNEGRFYSVDTFQFAYILFAWKPETIK